MASTPLTYSQFAQPSLVHAGINPVLHCLQTVYSTLQCNDHVADKNGLRMGGAIVTIPIVP